MFEVIMTSISTLCTVVTTVIVVMQYKDKK